MKARTILRPGRCALVLLALVLAGCAGPLDPTTRPTIATTSRVETAAGGVASRDGFYPLQIGNQWLHRGEQDVRIVPNGGQGPPAVRTRIAWETRRELVCIQSFDGVPYVVEHATVYGPNGTYETWNFYRQTTTGLYELDILGTDPPPCQGAAGTVARPGAAPASIDERVMADLVATRPGPERAAYQVALRRLRERMTALDRIRRPGPGTMLETGSPEGALPGELTRLRYPLELKAQWVIRNDPDIRFTARVDGVDVLNLPPRRLAGFRVRIEYNQMGPADVIHFWYGRQGYLQSVAHAEVDAVDDQGNVLGRAVLDERDALIGLSLVGEASAPPPKRPRR